MGENKVKVFCSNPACSFEDECEPDEYGLDFYQAIGTCMMCDSPMVYENGKPTAVVVEIKINLK